MSQFTHIPSTGFAASNKPKVTMATFGDGYSQRLSFGLNPLAKEWDLTFTNQDLTTAAEIISFLETRNGVDMFTWTPPESTEVKVICQEWNEQYASPISRTITAKFVQVFDL